MVVLGQLPPSKIAPPPILNLLTLTLTIKQFTSEEIVRIPFMGYIYTLKVLKYLTTMETV